MADLNPPGGNYTVPGFAEDGGSNWLMKYSKAFSQDKATLYYGAALNLVFAGAASLDSRITFTRASSATYQAIDGTLKLAGNNVPRFGYDLVTGNPLGFLREEGRTNLFLNSLLDSSNLATQSVTPGAVACCLSFYGTGTIDMTGGAIATLNGGGVFPNRAVLLFTPSALPILCTVTGTVQYAQIEVCSASYNGPTSFIPSTGAVGVRSNETATMTGTNFSSWFNYAGGTFISTDTPLGNYDYFGFAYCAGDGVFTHVAGLLRNNGGGIGGGIGRRWNAAFREAGFFSSNGPAVDVGNTSKIAWAYGPGDSMIAVGGVLGGAAVPNLTNNLNRLSIGSADDGSSRYNGYISSLQYYGSRLANSQLQSFST